MTNNSTDAALDALVDDIQSSPKYRALCSATIRDVASDELRRQSSLRAATAAARRRLHRLWAQFLGTSDCESSVRELDVAFADGAVEETCRAIMSRHASTLERLDDLSELYHGLFAITGVPGSIHDLASALHPFGFRWMGLPRTVRYRAFDINSELVELTNHYFRLEGIDGIAEHRDVLCDPPSEPADLALLFKMYHCLEHRRRGAGWEVVQRVPARWVAVSFPTQNLHGRRANIAGNYESEIAAGCEGEGWSIERCGVPSETVIVIKKR